ncbi:protein trichome birefringence-like 18 isoform X2 [Salvia miltiorrhiza]|uniref:protein trichome birefringence-like 18 isoform X2 n=1 Tax=Salvia miltiorrhiza TaxID=226208 RepID=UPI0025AC207F|nr:protein trichome birefringence-like 18 isoform X2 [Salvia miltiorrhiza]XP_057798409.1 protein trichome birefringence-like 18 isoform X2 [Salvia miltiorrhiza]
MKSVSFKEWQKTSYPKALLSIIASVGGLALFLLLASTLLVSQPIGSTIRGYFYGVNGPRKLDSESSLNLSAAESDHIVQPFVEGDKSNVTAFADHQSEVNDGSKLDESGEGDSKGTLIERAKNETSESGQVESENLEDKRDSMNTLLPDKSFEGSASVASGDKPTVLTESVDSSAAVTNLSQPNVAEAVGSSPGDTYVAECDLYHGKWIHDAAGPLYRNDSCPIITQMQNCQGNGRPDKDYENWRWKPSQCDLPRFDARKFLELMRGKTLAFIGDSVARNQMESMLCILWQVEAPKNRGNKKMQRYYFRSTSTMIVRIWSSWLVHQTSEPFDYAPAGVTKLHLDAPDEGFMEYITEFDVIVLSSGHWFAKQSVYILNNEIVGGQLWWPDKSRPKKIDNIEAFGISVETILTTMGTHPNYTGITIVRSFSPDHYEGGAWNTGGSCTGKERPLEGKFVENGFTNIMHEKQVNGFNRAVEKKTNKSKIKLMDITEVFSYRHDGHPGPYRSPDPNKITKRGPDGKPPPQDCLHWCMPGPVDTWNELVFEIIRRESFDGQ